MDVQLTRSFATASAQGSFQSAFEVNLRLGKNPMGPVALPNINVVGVGGALDVWVSQ